MFATGVKLSGENSIIGGCVAEGPYKIEGSILQKYYIY